MNALEDLKCLRNCADSERKTYQEGIDKYYERHGNKEHAYLRTWLELESYYHGRANAFNEAIQILERQSND